MKYRRTVVINHNQEEGEYLPAIAFSEAPPEVFCKLPPPGCVGGFVGWFPVCPPGVGGGVEGVVGGGVLAATTVG